MRYHRTTSGFTLIEFSIVMIVIGLVIGSIMVGRDLIRHAELRKTYQQIEEYRVAVATFKNKYDALPGDMPNATDIFGTDPEGCTLVPVTRYAKKETCNGDGNGFIERISPVLEVYRFWQHLGAAELIPGLYGGHLSPDENTRPLIHSLNDAYWDVAEQSRFYDLLSGIDADSTNDQEQFHIFYMWHDDPQFVRNAFATIAEAMAFDEKYDDGHAATGNIRALSQYYAPAQCISGTNYNVNLINTDRRYCYLIIDALF